MVDAPHIEKRYICKHCHVQVISKLDTRPALGKVHGKRCPRRNKV